MVFSIEEEMNRMAVLKQERDPDAFLLAIRTLTQTYVNIERRIDCLERRSDLGVASFLVLWDAFANVRNKGALTKEVVDYTVNEIVAYLEERGGRQSARLKHLMMALQDPDGTWE
jgi:hypothetical protein